MKTTKRALTLSPLSIFGALLAASLAGCGGGGGGGSGGGGNATLPGIYVDAATGDDTGGDGSPAKPFKTIKRGVQNAGTGDVVRVGPGTYDAALGEHFPIQPGFGVTIVGTEKQTALRIMRLTKIVGGALWSGDPLGRLHATIVPSFDDHLVSLDIHNPEPFVIGGPKPAPVVLAFSGVTLESCLLHDSSRGVRMVEGATGTLIKGCSFIANGIGIFPDGSGANNRVEGCLISENGTGVMCFSGGVDFGGGAAGSLGGNAFTANGGPTGGNDFVHFTGTSETIYAEDCLWDHAPPTVGSPPAIVDADVWEGTGPVSTAGAALYVPDPFVPFPGPATGP